MKVASLLDRFERTAPNHLRLGLVKVALRVLDVAGDVDVVIEDHPFLLDYLRELMQLTGGALPKAQEWEEALRSWRRGQDDLPLARLEGSGLGTLDIDVLLTLGFAQEDPRLATLFATDSRRLSLGAIEALWDDLENPPSGESVRGGLARLCELGLAAVLDREKVPLDWEYRIAGPLWDALGGIARPPEGMTLSLVDALPEAATFVPPRADFPALEGLAAVLAGATPPILCLRGPGRNGRHMLAGCLMRLLGRPLLTVGEDAIEDLASWRLAGALAVVTGAGLAVEVKPGTGEERVLPAMPLGGVPLLVIAGATGGVRAADRRPLVTVALPIPHSAARSALWRSTGVDCGPRGAAALAAEFRLTSGTIVGAAEAAAAQARVEGRSAISRLDVRTAIRTLHDARLEAVARRVDAGANGAFIALDELARDELGALAARCRHREALADADGAGAAGASGVRGLFAGPSGTGKTLAAQWLAQCLGKDLFRIDLAASVSKYIGETEKNLDRAFAAAEELDCILLFDEGDALMTRRTDVGSANDRYANLETNFLLQRIEGYEGILLVTSNAPDRIDEAFARRMDIVVQFRLPDEALRYEILDRHLGAHVASDALLQEIACRCALSGGQLRNLALHARLLALDSEASLGDGHLCAALLREYRKIDSHCPLKPHFAAAV